MKEPSTKPAKLTTKQRKLIKGKAEGKTTREACKKAGLNEQYACDLLKKPEIQASLQELMAKHGLDDASILSMHSEMIHASKVVSAVGGNDAGAGSVDFIDVPDWQARGKGIEMAYKLKGAFTEVVKIEVSDSLAETMKAARERAGI